MSHRKEDKLKNSENLLNYIPYNKMIDFGDKEYLESFLVYIGNKHTVLPEMGSVMNPEQLFNFLFAFAGQTIHIPEQKVILDSFRDMDIFRSLTINSSFTEIQRLASKYQTTTQTIRAAADRVAIALHKDSPLK